MHAFRSVALDDEKGELVLLDQTLLPNEISYIRLSKVEDIWEAIRNLRVRGAPAIGIAAAYGVYLAVRNSANITESGALISIDSAVATFKKASSIWRAHGQPLSTSFGLLTAWSGGLPWNVMH